VIQINSALSYLGSNPTQVQLLQPLLPTEDCLFQVQDAKLFKASSMVRDAGLLGVWNAADAGKVEGSIKPNDVRNIKGRFCFV